MTTDPHKESQGAMVAADGIEVRRPRAFSSTLGSPPEVGGRPGGGALPARGQ